MVIKRNYLLAQPHVTALIRFTDWLGLRLEAGYMYSYSFRKGWYGQLPDGFSSISDEKIDIKQSPATPLQGATYSVGFWFGF